MTSTKDRVAYLNGSYVPLDQAKVSVMDRGFLFADGVYEVSAVIDGRLVDNDAHLARLERSLSELRIQNPYSAADWIAIEEAMIARNALKTGVVYIQVTRGVADRDFVYAPTLEPTVILFTQTKNLIDNPVATRGAKVVTMPDLRWARRDIKSVALLAQVLAKQAASEAGADEAWMVEDGFVTEGGSSTAFIVTPDKRVVTRPLSNAVLPGITRRSVMKLADEAGLAVEERLFTVAEAKAAAEAFLTGAGTLVLPIVSIDGTPVGDGRPGPLALKLREIYIAFARV